MANKLRWTPALVNAFWNGVARSELDDLSFGKVAGPRFLDLVAGHLPRDGRHLDFGAGGGHFLRLLLDRGLKAGGFDPSSDRQGQLVSAIGDRAGFLGVVGPGSEEQFDVVFLMEVVEHVLAEDFDAVLRRVADFVKPGGLVIVSTPHDEDLAHSAVFCPSCETLFHPWQHVRSFTPESLEGVFSAAGFSRVFLALADFSCDADFYEASKRAVAMESAIAHLQGAIEAQIRARAERRSDFDGYAAVGGGLSIRGIARMLRSPWRTLRYWRLLPEDAEGLEQLLRHAGQELARVRALKVDAAGESASVPGAVDMRIGRETTIVYVGRKA